MSEGRAVIASCSFCLKPNTSVKRLVAGPGVFICNECVELCNQLVAGEGSRVPTVAPWEHATSADEVLAHLPLVAAAGAQVDRNLAGGGGTARSLGRTWARIREALGMTRQSAWDRFSAQE